MWCNCYVFHTSGKANFVPYLILVADGIRVVENGWEILSQAIPTNKDRFVIKRIARFGEAVFKDEIKAKAEDKSFVLGAFDWGYPNDKMPWELQNLKKLPSKIIKI
jgi:hypothetical protein